MHFSNSEFLTLPVVGAVAGVPISTSVKHQSSSTCVCRHASHVSTQIVVPHMCQQKMEVDDNNLTSGEVQYNSDEKDK